MTSQGLEELTNALEEIQRTPQEGQDSTGHSENPDTSRDVADPLGDVSLDALRKHPRLGSEIQSLVDQAVATQMRGRTAAVRRQLEQELRPQIEQQVRDNVLRERWADMSADEIVRDIADDKDLAADYARLHAQDRPVTPADIDYRVRVETYKQRIVEVSELLSNSGLPADQADKLKPENYDFATRGDEGLMAWDNDVREAIFSHKAQTASDAKRQEELAKQDEQNGPDYSSASIANGRREQVPSNGIFRTPDGKVDTAKSLEHILATQR